MTRFRLWAGAASLVVISACVGQDDTPDPSGDAGTPAVALLTAGPVSDAGWYAGAYEGLQLIGDSLGFRVSHQQTRTPAEFDEAFISYAEAGYGLIFGHGFEYQDAASRAGEQYPDVTFVVSSGSRSAENVIPIIFGLHEASYLAGMAAGAVTRSGIVGMVGGVEIPSAKGTFVAFEAGVRATRADAVVLETFIGSWDDVSAAKEAAAAQLRQGADALIHNVDAATFGFFQAVREARAAGGTAWAFGMNRDQNDVAPDVIVGSAVINIPAIFLQVALDWRAGTLSGPQFTGLVGRHRTASFRPMSCAPLPRPARRSSPGRSRCRRSTFSSLPRARKAPRARRASWAQRTPASREPRSRRNPGEGPASDRRRATR